MKISDTLQMLYNEEIEPLYFVIMKFIYSSTIINVSFYNNTMLLIEKVIF